MRNVILSLALLLGCSDGSGFVAAPDADPAAASTGFARGRQVETGGQGGNSQPRASQDAQAPDSRVVVADAMPVQPDAIPMTFDTTPTPPPEPTGEWFGTEPPVKGQTCQSAKPNSLGIGTPCQKGDGVCGKMGLYCGCAMPYEYPLGSLVLDLPCFCVASKTAGIGSPATCDDCGSGAGCCKITDRYYKTGNEQFLCLPSACSDFCRLAPPKS